jgi:hypothetical protein
MIEKICIEYHQASSLRLLGEACRDRQSSLLVVSVSYRVGRRQIACPGRELAVWLRRELTTGAMELIGRTAAKKTKRNRHLRVSKMVPLIVAVLSIPGKILMGTRTQPLRLGDNRSPVKVHRSKHNNKQRSLSPFLAGCLVGVLKPLATDTSWFTCVSRPARICQTGQFVIVVWR